MYKFSLVLASIFTLLVFGACKKKDGKSGPDPSGEALQLLVSQPKSPVGLPVTATAEYRNDAGEWSDVSGDCAWSSTDPGIADVVAGLITPVAPGTCTIGCSAQGLDATFDIEVTDATLVNLVITPGPYELGFGISYPLTAAAVYSDNAVYDVTDSANWTSADDNIATVGDAPGNKGFVTTQATQGLAQITAEMSGLPDTWGIFVVDSALTAVTISRIDADDTVNDPVGPAVVGEAIPLLALATSVPTAGGNDLVSDVTASVQFSSSDPAIATVSNEVGTEGWVTTHAPGTTTISATAGGVTGAVDLTVEDKTLTSITIYPINELADETVIPDGFEIACGQSIPFKAVGTWDDGSQHDITTVTSWASSVVPVGRTQPATMGLAAVPLDPPGTIDVIATVGGVSDTLNLSCTDAAFPDIDGTGLTANYTNAAGPCGESDYFTSIDVHSHNGKIHLFHPVNRTLNSGFVTTDGSVVARRLRGLESYAGHIDTTLTAQTIAVEATCGKTTWSVSVTLP